MDASNMLASNLYFYCHLSEGTAMSTTNVGVRPTVATAEAGILGGLIGDFMDSHADEDVDLWRRRRDRPDPYPEPEPEPFPG